MSVDSEENNVPFCLQCTSMSGTNIFLHNINPQHTIFMIKNLLTDRLVLRNVLLRLLFNGIVLEDNRSLESYNVNNHSIIVFVERLSGGARTRRTAVLSTNENSEVDLDSSDESSEDDKDDEKTDECPLCKESDMYGTNYNNDECEDKVTLYM